ncbi:MAG: ATP-dependent zinc metalloprotease FtsH [Oscillospiraceae bacterium]|nr:ATP-dependent zinc metalloprotease FtsH [Oscillospiraceae bacterium]
MQKSNSKGIFIYLAIIAVLIVAFVYVVGNFKAKAAPQNYSAVISKFDNLEVCWYSLDLGKGELRYITKGDLPTKADKLAELQKTEGNSGATLFNVADKYSVPNISLFITDTKDYRVNYNERNTGEPLVMNYVKEADNTFVTQFLPYIVLIVIMIVFSFFIMRQAGGGGKMASFGLAKTKEGHIGKKITFADVAGADEEKEELKEIVDFLKDSKKYQEIGARVPRGVLLVGPPGTGKTLLAKAVAGEADAPFFSISGSDFVEMFVGVGASRVRDLFDKAKKKTPSIIFIDEIDAVGRHRGAGLGGGHDEREQTLNQLLVEMDGFNETENIIVMAATNRQDILDPALMRPGRFDRQIVVNYPDIKGREEILAVHQKGKKFFSDVKMSDIAKTTSGFTGADLANLLNESALLAARNNRKSITNEDIREALMKIVAGPEKKSKTILEKDKQKTAYHEAGHAICHYFCPTQDKVHIVSIIPRGMALGYVISLPEHDKFSHYKTEFEERIVVCLAGRVAEKLIFDDISTGASNDIAKATEIARNMVTRYGFSEKLGPVLYGHENPEVFLGRDYSQGRNYSESIAALIDDEVKSIMETGYDRAMDILKRESAKLHLIAKYLIEHEKIDGEDFEKLMAEKIEEIADPELKQEAEQELNILPPPVV